MSSSSEGGLREATKRLQPSRQTLDDAYSPPGKTKNTIYYLKSGNVWFFFCEKDNFLELEVTDPETKEIITGTSSK